MAHPEESNVIAENRRGRFDFDIKENFEAGIELKGYEVKSAKRGSFQIAGSHVLVRGNEAWLINSQLPAYQPKNMPEDYEVDRTRRLLLSREEIKVLSEALKDKSVRIIPLRAYLKHGFIKIDIGVGKTRRKSDKREVIKKRSHRREMRDDI